MKQKPTTLLKELLVLGRVQSVPVTVFSLCLGYATATETVLNPSLVYLAIIGGLGHLGFYALNDYLDLRYDKIYKNTDKPLVSGTVNKSEAGVFILVTSLASVVVAATFLGVYAFYWYIVAMIFGLTYNLFSKKHTMSGLYLSGWGFAIVITGSHQGGEPNTASYLIAATLAIQMLIMTIEGDIKDLDAMEPSIPRSLGSRIIFHRDKPWVRHSNVFLLAWTALQAAQASPPIVLTFADGVNLYPDFLVLIFAVVSQFVGTFVIMERVYDKEKIKKIIVIYTVVVLLLVGSSALVFMGLLELMMALTGTIIWGLSWQRILYGRFFYFP